MYQTIKSMLESAGRKIASGNGSGARKEIVEAIEFLEKAEAEQAMTDEAMLAEMEAAFGYGEMVAGRIKV